MQTILEFASWLFDFLRYCLHHLRPRFSLKVCLFLCLCLLLSLFRARRRTSALTFTEENSRPKSEPKKHRMVGSEKRKVTAECIQRFVEKLTKTVGETMAQEHQDYVSRRRALLRSDFPQYQQCVCDWLQRLDAAIGRQAHEIAAADGIPWTRLEPMLAKYMRFSRFKLCIPSLHLRVPAPCRKLSFPSCSEVLDFASKLQSRGVPARSDLLPAVRAKVVEAVVEDEVWLTFNVELATARDAALQVWQ